MASRKVSNCYLEWDLFGVDRQDGIFSLSIREVPASFSKVDICNTERLRGLVNI